MVNKTPAEIAEMEDLIAKGELPKDAIKKHFESESKNVFGHDAKRDRKGEFIEQGIGSVGHETANHFAALLKAEQMGSEPEGTYQAALAEIWKRDPKRATQLRLPKVKVAA